RLVSVGLCVERARVEQEGHYRFPTSLRNRSRLFHLAYGLPPPWPLPRLRKCLRAAGAPMTERMPSRMSSDCGRPLAAATRPSRAASSSDRYTDVFFIPYVGYQTTIRWRRIDRGR